MSAEIDLLINLINRPSVTPEDCGCQQVIAERLQALGFHIQHLRFGEVDNLWACLYDDKNLPMLAFAGHTDVVPAGDENAWQSPPFVASEREGVLYGRGACDMKGSIASMVVACEQFLATESKPNFNIGFLITSDEEGVATHGTVKVVEWLLEQQQAIDWCIVGEPSSQKKLCDQVKNGRRGSLTGYLTVKGVQGHVAYPHLSKNPIHGFAPAMAALCAKQWDAGNEFFPPTGFQITSIKAGVGASNVTPATLDVVFNFRYSTELTHEGIQASVNQILQQHEVDYDLEWQHSGKPFLTEAGLLVDISQQAINKVCGYDTQLSTSGGTSDGRFIAPMMGAQLLEIGVSNASIHQVNENVLMADIEQLTVVYQEILALFQNRE